MMMAHVHRTEFHWVKTDYMARKFFLVSMCISLCLYSTSLVEAQDKFSRYPGSADMNSPNGLYVLSNVDNEKIEPSHFLVVRSTLAEKEEIRIPYARYVEVAWSPDGKRLAINDHGGSNYTNCKILSFGENVRPIEIAKHLRAKISPPSITKNHHVFLECVEWMGNDRVRIKAHGYGDLNPEGFSESYVFQVETGFFEANERKQR